MAYEVKDEELPQGGTAASNDVNQVPVGVGSSVVVPNSGVQSVSDSGSDQKSSGAYTNLQKYVSANADQTGGLAEKTAAPIQQGVQQTKDSANSANQQFQNQVQQNTVGYDSNLLDSIQPGGAKPAGQLSQEEKQKIASMRDASYKGPTSLYDTGALQDAYNTKAKTQDLAKLTGSEDGRFELLRQAFGQNGNQYRRGEQRLDQALIQQDPNAQNYLSTVSDKAKALDPELDSIQSQSQALARRAADETQYASNRTKDRLQDAYTGTISQADELAKTSQAARDKKYQDLLETLNTPYKSQGDAQWNKLQELLYGKKVDDPTYDPLDVNTYKKPSDYVRMGEAANRSSVTTMDEAKNFLALEELLQRNQSALIPEQVGQFNPAVVVDSEQYKNDAYNSMNTWNSKNSIANFLESPANFQTATVQGLGPNSSNKDWLDNLGTQLSTHPDFYAYTNMYDPRWDRDTLVGTFQPAVEKQIQALNNAGVKAPTAPKFDQVAFDKASRPRQVEMLSRYAHELSGTMTYLKEISDRYNPETFKQKVMS